MQIWLLDSIHNTSAWCFAEITNLRLSWAVTSKSRGSLVRFVEQRRETIRLCPPLHLPATDICHNAWMAQRDFDLTRILFSKGHLCTGERIPQCFSLGQLACEWGRLFFSLKFQLGLRRCFHICDRYPASAESVSALASASGPGLSRFFFSSTDCGLHVFHRTT